MATTNIRFLHQETSIADIGNVQNTQSYILSENDTDLGYRMIGYVDGLGNSYRLLSKDQDISAKNIYGNEYIYHNGDLDTYIRFRDNQTSYVSGNITYIDTQSGSSNQIKINPNSSNVTLHHYGSSGRVFHTDSLSLIIDTDKRLALGNSSFGILTYTTTTNRLLLSNITTDIEITTNDLYLDVISDLFLQVGGTDYAEFDTDGLKVKNGASVSMVSQATEPSTTHEGMLWLDSTNSQVNVYFNGDWRKLGDLTNIAGYSSESSASSQSTSSASSYSSSSSSPLKSSSSSSSSSSTSTSLSSTSPSSLNSSSSTSTSDSSNSSSQSISSSSSST